MQTKGWNRRFQNHDQTFNIYEFKTNQAKKEKKRKKRFF